MHPSTPCQRCGLRPAVATVRAVGRGVPPREVRLCEVCLHEGQVAARGIDRGLFDQFLASLNQPGTGEPSMVPSGSAPVRHLDITQFFSDATREVVRLAIERAAGRGSSDVDDDDLLAGTLAQDAAARLVERAGGDVGGLRGALDAAAPAGGQGEPQVLSPDAKRVLLQAFDVSRAMRSSYLGPEHLLLVMAADPSSPVGRLLRRYGITPEALQAQLLREPVAGEPPAGGGGQTRTPTLDRFGRDLTALARDGKLDPVIGRA